ncbi:hypothetical protein HDV00_005086 [Rhizophlyctis rosea]|nr:hypothetical protein HDV00_005086 [Rhizophlyctis rosea]
MGGLWKSLRDGAINPHILDLVASAASTVINCDSTTSPNAINTLPTLLDFLSTLTSRSRVHLISVLAALTYLRRISQKLPTTARGLPCTAHRLLLAALLLGCKYTSDAPLNNRAWAEFAELFPLAEVNLMERQLLFLLDFDLRMSERDLMDVLPSMQDSGVSESECACGNEGTEETAGEDDGSFPGADDKRSLPPALEPVPSSCLGSRRREVLEMGVRTVVVGSGPASTGIHVTVSGEVKKGLSRASSIHILESGDVEEDVLRTRGTALAVEVLCTAPITPIIH